MSLSNRIVSDYACGGMIAYVGEWNEEVRGLIRNQAGRVALIDL